MNNGFTNTETRILALLSDGIPHTKEEIHRCLSDELSELTAIQPHISRIRKRLDNVGQDIVCVYSRKRTMYQHVRKLYSANNGRT